MKNSQEKNYTPEEVAEIQEKRTLSDADLIKGGAQYQIGKDTDIFFEPTKKQIESITREHEMELPKTAILMEVSSNKEINSAKTAREMLEKAGYEISSSGYSKPEDRDLLEKINWEKKLKSSYELVSISVGELFTDKKTHSYAEIINKAKQFGLDLVPASLFPSIRLNYPNLTGFEFLASEAINDGLGHLKIFNFCNNKEGHSCSYSGDVDEREYFRDYDRFTFSI